MSLSLIIKSRLIPGAVHQAQMRGIKLLSAQTLRKGEIAATAADSDLDAVARWFSEQGAAPFAWGTLLYYSVKEAPGRDTRPRE